MHIVRTIVWILVLVALGIFSFANWDPRITVYIWSGIVVDTRLPAIVIVSFLLGFLPMWLLHKSSRWHFRRRISTLEAAMRNTTPAPAADQAPGSAPVTSPATATATATPASTPAAEGKPVLP